MRVIFHSLNFIFLLMLANTQVFSRKLEHNTNLNTLLDTKSTLGIFVTMKNGTKELLNMVSSQKFDSRAERIVVIVQALKSHEKSTQESIQQFLQNESISFQSFWISNQIYIPRASFQLRSQLAVRHDVAKITEEGVVLIEEPVMTKEHEMHDDATHDTQWGISQIEADRVWEEFGNTGSGIVVGMIDTGVRGTHQDLRNNYRTPYGWFDPSLESSTPNDIHGHGTHCMGTMAGANGIGVAPGSKWMACKGCQTGSCLYSDLILCGQWMLCPTLEDGTEEDCSKAPHLVSNSWAGGQGQTMYDLVIYAWKAAGIIPIFGAGNAGSACNTVLSPGDSEEVIGVGATNGLDELEYYSSRGPSYYGSLKPDISAPGFTIYSSFFIADNSYVTLSGTSMATPHVAGAIALILSMDNNLSYDQVKSLLTSGSETTALRHCEQNCGGINGSSYPNNCFGHGRLNVYKSISYYIHKNVLL